MACFCDSICRNRGEHQTIFVYQAASEERSGLYGAGGDEGGGDYDLGGKMWEWGAGWVCV